MSWKNTKLFFLYQNLLFSRNADERRKNQSNYSRWIKSFEKNRTSMNDESAWITFDALDYLHHTLKPEHVVFEFGGGGSTLFFCNRVNKVVTVEHDKMWFEAMSSTILSKKHDNWTGYQISSEATENWANLNAENPLDFVSRSPDQVGMQFEKYVRCIELFEDQSFDVVLVDGRARASCIYFAIPKVKKGGLLVIDNAERPYYLPYFKDTIQREFSIELDTYSPVPYSPDFSQTLILRKR